MEKVALVLGVVVAILLLMLALWPTAPAFWLSGPIGLAATLVGYRMREKAEGKSGLVLGVIAVCAFISLLVGTGDFPPQP